MSSWPVKITFRTNPDKEFTKEIKIDPQSTILNLLFKACELFDLKDAHNYAISFKKVILPSLESIKETKLAQGNTVSLIRHIKSRENREIIFNFRAQIGSTPMKLIGRFLSEDNFINCLQNVPSDSSNIDLLKQPSKLPIVSILSAKLTTKDLMKMSDFTLESLGLKGNYLVTINYAETNENNSEFAEFLGRPKNLKREITENCSCLKMEQKSRTNVLSSALSENPITLSPVAVKVNEISYEIFSQSKDSIPAPDVTDSFFDLSKEEILAYQRGLQNISKSINERPFASMKSKTKIETSSTSRFVPIKLVFNNQTFVQAEFSLNWPVGSIVDFIEGVIFDSHEDKIELWTGSPSKHLSSMQKSIFECGITGPTRIAVNCKRYTLRKDLIINKK